MKYRNIHTGEVQEWHVETVSVTPTETIEVMVPESGMRQAVLGESETPPFLDCHEPVEEPATGSTEEA